MYDVATRKHALRLLADGRSMNSVSKETGISRAAITPEDEGLLPLHPQQQTPARPPPPDAAA
ncbi:hypothetical protein ACFVZ8_22080, partial [Streptomyces sp. NPDC059558]